MTGSSCEGRVGSGVGAREILIEIGGWHGRRRCFFLLARADGIALLYQRIGRSPSFHALPSGFHDYYTYRVVPRGMECVLGVGSGGCFRFQRFFAPFSLNG